MILDYIIYKPIILKRNGSGCILRMVLPRHTTASR
jgi:hypothetical protein